MITNSSFVYCWTDHKKGKLYVGSHKGTADDGYICSSKYMLEEYYKRPEDFTRQIIAEESFEDIRKLEVSILRGVDARINEDFYNQHNGNGKFFLKHHTKATREKMSKMKMGELNINHKKNLTEDRRLRFVEFGKKSKGIKKSVLAKENIRKGKLGAKNPNYGKKGGFDHINKKTYMCEYCSFITTPGNYKRWHGTKCKHKLDTNNN
jgi:hypothetical protein